MPEDQSVVGRRRIYYDQNGSEALICSDSEEEAADDEDEKHEFSKGEDFILWYGSFILVISMIKLVLPTIFRCLHPFVTSGCQ